MDTFVTARAVDATVRTLEADGRRGDLRALAPVAKLNWSESHQRYVEVVDELPKTPTEKVRKNELRARGLGPAAWDRKAAGIVGSDSGKVGTSGEAISAACRGRLISFAKSLAREFARHQVLVNVVCPGPTDTSLWEEPVDNDEFGGKLGNAMIRAIPLRRNARPEEVAAAAVFLLSDEASFITGQAVSVSGGLTMS